MGTGQILGMVWALLYTKTEMIWSATRKKTCLLYCNSNSRTWPRAPPQVQYLAQQDLPRRAVRHVSAHVLHIAAYIYHIGPKATLAPIYKGGYPEGTHSVLVQVFVQHRENWYVHWLCHVASSIRRHMLCTCRRAVFCSIYRVLIDADRSLVPLVAFKE